METQFQQTVQAVRATLEARYPTDRQGAIAFIRQHLKRRSGKGWSVRGGHGTSYGWITITSPPRRCTGEFNYMPEPECVELGKLLGLPRPVHCQGELIAASRDYRLEYCQRADGHTPQITGTPFTKGK